MSRLTSDEIRPLMHAAIRGALDGARAILEVRARGFDVQYKDDCSPLTEADLAAHQAIEARLEPTGYPVLSEESAEVPYAERAGWHRFWLVDPLDGTKEFVKDNGEFTVNVALIEAGRPVLGVVQVPVHDTIYWGFVADQGRQAFKADASAGSTPEQLAERRQPLEIEAGRPPVAPVRVVASRSHCNDATLRFIEQLEADHGQVERVSRGSSLKLCLIAEGAARIYPRIAPTMEWDTGAAHAVIAAAGGGVWAYDPQLPPAAYLAADPAAAGARPLQYNKDDLLNPFFVAC
jgi:3'(2'), 5'-bisphosphate nucleotidase